MHDQVLSDAVGLDALVFHDPPSAIESASDEVLVVFTNF